MESKYNSLRRFLDPILVAGMLYGSSVGAYAGESKVSTKEEKNAIELKNMSEQLSRQLIEDKNSRKTASQITSEYLDANPRPVPIIRKDDNGSNSGLKVGVSTDDKGDLEYTVGYSFGTWKEFANGMAMPFTLYRENKATGKTEILPAYTRAFRSGGIASPIEGLVASTVNGVGHLFGKEDQIMYNAFTDNPRLTWGVVADYAALALIANGGSSKGDSKPSQETTYVASSSSHSDSKPTETTTSESSNGGSSGPGTPPPTPTTPSVTVTTWGTGSSTGGKN